MFITLDGNYSVQKINMGISKHANINWARELKIVQDFEKGPDGRYHVIKSNTIAEFAITKGSDGGMLGERTVTLKNFIINKPQPESLYKGESVVTTDNAANAPDSFWAAHRFSPLTASEAKVYTNIDTLVSKKSFRRKFKALSCIRQHNGFALR